MKRLNVMFAHRTVRTRVLIIFTVLVLTLISLFTIVFAYFESKNLQDHYKQLSKQTANGLSFMPALAEAIVAEDPNEVQGIILTP